MPSRLGSQRGRCPDVDHLLLPLKLSGLEMLAGPHRDAPHVRLPEARLCGNRPHLTSVDSGKSEVWEYVYRPWALDCPKLIWRNHTMVTPPVPRTDTSFHTLKGVGNALRGHTTTVPDAELSPKTLWAILPREPILLPSCQQCLQRTHENGLSGQWRLCTSQKPQGGETV